MLASGEVVTCAPDQNAALFAAALGGYGLCGVILDVELEMAENVLLHPTIEVIHASSFGPRFAAAIEGAPEVRMAYGRLAVDARRFLSEALLVTYKPIPGQPSPATSGGLMNALSREVFRAQIGSDAAKRVRWYAETVVGPAVASGETSRNTLLNEPVANLAGRDRSRTDILHEYFLPPEGLENFLAACRRIIPASRQELLNVTLRYVRQDRQSLLAYAQGNRVAAVMLFSQRMTPTDEADMRAMTERLIDAALESSGSFYLPYRLHARPDQLARAYPRVEEFLARKREYDPGTLFRNLMWDRYFAA
jgi:FAD/FMN-containing dehydrogenase